MSSPIDIIKAANKNEPLRIELELPGSVKCWMHSPNRHQIVEVREKLYRLAYAEASEIGLVGKPINEAEYLEAAESFGSDDQQKPHDLAEQYAKSQSVRQLFYNIIPTLIRDEHGKELFPSLSEKRAFLTEVFDHPDIEKYLIDKWRELFSLKESVEQDAKNL